MLIPQGSGPLGSGPLGSGPTGPGSGFSVMPSISVSNTLVSTGPYVLLKGVCNGK